MGMGMEITQFWCFFTIDSKRNTNVTGYYNTIVRILVCDELQKKKVKLTLREGAVVKNSKTTVISSNPAHNYGRDCKFLLIFTCFLLYIPRQRC